MAERDTDVSPEVTRGQPFKRGYVACIGCRSRKVKCALGSKPPCAKCRREHRECLFQPSRRSVKRREAPKWTSQQSQVHSNPARPEQSVNESRSGRQSPTPGVESPRESLEGFNSGNNPASRNDHSITDRVISTVLTRPSETLDVLFDAAQLRLPAEGTTVSHIGTGSPHADSGPSVNNWIASTYAGLGLVSVNELSRPAEEVLDLWDKCRFVRQGWFTAQEAVTYLDLLYYHLAPLSPVLSDIYREHKNHDRLIIEEPMLCCTLLMISSRYFVLPGAGGVSRGHFIHYKLWQYCELLIRRIMLGQEKYSTAKTRALGSIESLLLISDWHPRSVHFPPETEGWDGELISPAYDRQNRLHTDTNLPLIRWREDVFEPSKRSERMSWMLLGAAVSLAYELGVFSDSPSMFSSDNCPQSARMSRARKLLYVHLNQMAVKIGCTSSLLPDNISLPLTPSSKSTLDSSDKIWETFMKFWIDLTRLIKTSSSMFFQSMPYIKQQLLSGHYIILLQHFTPSLTRWYQDFTAISPSLPHSLCHLILIEYHHLKAYSSALSVQAVVERALARGVNHANDHDGNGLHECILPQDHSFILDVVVNCSEVLRIATRMASEGRLRYAPLRAVVCVTSSSVFLLKAISLGARNTDLRASLSILDECIVALRASAIDDMDFSLRYATLIEKHVSRFRANFIVPNIHEVSHGSNEMDQSYFTSGNCDSAINGLLPAFNPDWQSPPTSGGRDHNHSGVQQNPGLESERVYSGEDWWARPFDPNIAPFSFNSDTVSLGLELDSLDFLWNLPDIGA